MKGVRLRKKDSNPSINAVALVVFNVIACWLMPFTLAAQESGISDKIEDDESYRILIEKRNSDISSKEIITNIANQIKNKVSLDFPDKIILIEILGIVTGISLIKKSDILSLEKTKRSMSE